MTVEEQLASIRETLVGVSAKLETLVENAAESKVDVRELQDRFMNLHTEAAVERTKFDITSQLTEDLMRWRQNFWPKVIGIAMSVSAVVSFLAEWFSK